MKIMIIDNNDLMRKEIIQSVVMKDDIIMECADAELALKNCIDFNPDWILMDIKMKKINGLITAQKIKEMKPDVNIAFVTNYDYEAYHDAAKSIGAKHYFLKNDLLSIREILKKGNNKRRILC